MKKWIFLICLSAGTSIAFGQSKSYKKMPSFGVHFSLIDYNTAADLRTRSLANILEAKKWYNMGRMNPALTISYLEGLSDHLDFQGRLTSGFLRYPYQNPTFTPSTSQFYMEADANLNVKLLTDNYIVVPYLQAGVGASLANRTFMAHIPLGAGLQFKISKEAFLHLNTAYRLPVTDRANYSLFHSVGIVAPLKAVPVEETKPEVKTEVPKDRDGDGVLDDVDACPDVKGLASLKGCPDADKDGIADAEDKCPTEPGVAKYQGCPVPDRDKDGIIDENDKCPDVAGVARFDGCPVPDSDGDGVNDEEDRCPSVSGDPSNNGCPKLSFTSAPILFATSSAVLSASAKAELDKAVAFLNQNKEAKLLISGYTDATGNATLNSDLSNRRANAALNYLTAKGIDKSRLTVNGYGADHPVADNTSTEGKKLNRRVELSLNQ